MLKFAARTDKGLIREINEDSYAVIKANDGTPVAFIIADGMGGHNAGEIASRTAADFMGDRICTLISGDASETDMPALLKGLLQQANETVLGKSREQASNLGMGTTLITAVTFKKKLYIGHAGDSRFYLIRDSKINRITTDHSYIEELLKNGSITREEAVNHPKKHVITKALGGMESLEADIYVCEMHNNDCYVLCTDGLTNMVEEDLIEEIVLSLEPQEACDELVRTANINGGDDNITVIVIKNE